MEFTTRDEPFDHPRVEGRMKRRTASILVLMLLIATVLSTFALLGQRRLRQELSRVEQLVHEQRTSLGEATAEQLVAHRELQMIIRAQEFPWHHTEGSPIEVRLIPSFDESSVGIPIQLLAEIRNASDQEQRVSGLLLDAITIKVTKDGVEAKYLGANKSIAPGTIPPLPPGRIARAFTTITAREFEGIYQPGEFEAEWVYSSGYGARDLTWKGNLTAKAKWRVTRPKSR